MKNSDKLVQAFSDSLGIALEDVVDSLSYEAGDWDSVAHMSLVAEIESVFDIMMDTEDIIDLSSFGKAKDIVGKYGVDLDAEG